MSRFAISKLEDRIAPTSGVFAVNGVGEASFNDNGSIEHVANASDNLNGNSTVGGNTIGNAVFSDGNS